MKKTILFIVNCFICGMILAQNANFKVEISSDSLLMGNNLKVVFSIENAEASHFEAPEFEGFVVVGGPNTSSSFSMINGEVSQNMSYTYYLEPVDIGNYYIAPASVQVKDKVLETQPLEVLVLDNPDGIIQHPDKKSREDLDWFRGFSMPKWDTPAPTQPQKKKKKRKIYKL